jgi:hypothetical protein
MSGYCIYLNSRFSTKKLFNASGSFIIWVGCAPATAQTLNTSFLPVSEEVCRVEILKRKEYCRDSLADNGMPSAQPYDFVGASLRAAFPQSWIFPSGFAIDWYIHTF